MNFNTNPFQCVSFENPLDFNNSYTIQKISAVVADTTDKVIVDAIIEDAKNDGVDYLYLMDKHFIRNAIEKQIPKNPVENRYPWAICPVCGGSVYLRNVQEHIQNRENTHCEHCGQALDWSDTE